MIRKIIQIFVLALLFMIVFIKDIPYKNVFKNATIQLYLAFVSLLILMAYDNITGMLLVFCLLAIYFKIYNVELKQKKESFEEKKACSSNDKKCSLEEVKEYYDSDTEQQFTLEKKHFTQLPYITEEHLISAQNNIYSTDNYDKEVYGVEKGLYNENVYGIQGLDNKGIHIRGFDKLIIGNMSYSIIE